MADDLKMLQHGLRLIMQEQPKRELHASSLLRNVGLTATIPEGIKHVCFYMTSLGRTWQNLLTLWPREHSCGLRLADFNMLPSALAQFVQDNCQAALRAGQLYLHATQDVAHWDASLCKNAATVAAIERMQAAGHATQNLIMVNLHNDRVMGPLMPHHVATRFAADMPRPAVHYRSPWAEGSNGTICAVASDLIYLRAGV